MTGIEIDNLAISKALIEALNYASDLRNKKIVIKFGGNAMAKSDSVSKFCQDVITLYRCGIKPVIVHGGGPQISENMEKLGISSTFIDGLRVTDEKTLDVVRMVLVGKINREIVASVNSFGPYAVGLSGEDTVMIEAKPKSEKLGYVGEVAKVNPRILENLIENGLIPVVATVGMDLAGQAYNVNADNVAAALAVAIEAEKLLFLTNVPGILTDPADDKSLISEIRVTELQNLIDLGKVSGGMLPKARSCIDAINGGLKKVHILDGTRDHSILLEVFTNEGIGTMVTK